MTSSSGASSDQPRPLLLAVTPAARRSPAAQPARTTGAPAVTVVDVNREVADLAAKYGAGELDDYAFEQLVQRASRKYARACACVVDRCCSVHDQHVSPHQRCIMR